ncbi:MAG TPA: hypothetical protein DGA22_04860 [Acidobacterium sp.]|uniref:Uncharacterized protein n=1 Tax=Acidobacterium capsulatum (strain ATCC 51196 / DSM 11244 / BCRC 80197 / JCM 7670 / NBRC 15755 / NCIMB 13165 / 161) TaxID=240015 RepID=C1F3G9_ACIC5|nr:hypothetical protein ACP_0959 [Acidobacterium capsulatum ATCC 51196]HCT60195.1 hypothetical protein [Acidobacterium sp.]
MAEFFQSRHPLFSFPSSHLFLPLNAAPRSARMRPKIRIKTGFSLLTPASCNATAQTMKLLSPVLSAIDLHAEGPSAIAWQ